jgi:small-conductance mechanosensitive channel
MAFDYTAIPVVNEFMQLFNYQIGNNTLGNLIIAGVVFIVTFILLEIFRSIVLGKMRRLAFRSKTDIDDLLVSLMGNVGKPLYFLIAFYLAVRFVDIGTDALKLISYLVLIASTYYVVRVLQNGVNFFASKEIQKRAKQAEGEQRASLTKLITSAVNISLWALAALFLLSNFGFDITSLVAGLGIGGLAIALALQSVFGDVFAAISLYFDKPFKVGDFIIIGDDMGTVQHIGIKSTRIKTLQGQELIISNKELTSIRVNNYKNMEKRRVVFGFGVKYETKNAKLKRIPVIVKEIIDKTKKTEYNRAHFKNFGDFSLNYEVVYYVSTGDYTDYMNVQQEINFAINEAFEKEKIEMAYPTQTLYVKKNN